MNKLAMMYDLGEGGDDLIALYPGFAELQVEIEGLGGRHILEGEGLWPPRFRPRCRGPGLLACGVARVSGQLLEKRDHFLRVALPNDLQEQRLGGHIGQPTQLSNLVRHSVEAE